LDSQHLDSGEHLPDDPECPFRPYQARSRHLGCHAGAFVQFLGAAEVCPGLGPGAVILSLAESVRRSDRNHQGCDDLRPTAVRLSFFLTDERSPGSAETGEPMTDHGVTGTDSAASERPPDSVEELTRNNVERIQALEAREHEKATTADHVADAIANFAGSITFVLITVLLIGGWVVANLLLPQPARVDPFPFPLLTLVLSIEAIFLSIFILMSQNRAARVSDKRSHLDLQLNLLSEQENTKMLLLLERIGQAVGADTQTEPDVKVLVQATKPEALSRQIDQAIDAGGPGSGPPGQAS
jgi:uncharacterized membrane protein